jgi:hypothetical protein
MTTQRGHRQLPPDGRSSHASSPSAGRPPGRPGPLPTTSHDDDQAKSTLRWPSTACASFEGQAPTSGRRRAVMDTADDHADPGHPTVRLPAPPPPPTTSFPSHTADAGTHGHRTPEAGHWTPWTLRHPHRTSVTWTGTRRTADARTGHWTPGCRTQTRTRDHSTAGIRTSLAATPCHRAETPNRVPALALPAGCSAAPPAKPRLGALLSSDDFGSSVERRAKRQVLCRRHTRVDVAGRQWRIAMASHWKDRLS